MSTIYTSYVNHILRFYIRYPGLAQFKSEVDKMNYLAADRVFAKLKESEKSILTDIYTRKDTIPDNVYVTAKARGVNQDEIWRLILTVSAMIAEERKLISRRDDYGSE